VFLLVRELAPQVLVTNARPRLLCCGIGRRVIEDEDRVNVFARRGRDHRRDHALEKPPTVVAPPARTSPNERKCDHRPLGHERSCPCARRHPGVRAGVADEYVDHARVELE